MKLLLLALIIALAFANPYCHCFNENNEEVCLGECTGFETANGCENCARALRVIYSVASASGCAIACSPTGPYMAACNAACNALLTGACGSDCPTIACRTYHFC
ncbi:hypothetical protein RCL1_007297 [Eukaryota sp. TZLM3-RCL]